jgi:hypothetical protein
MQSLIVDRQSANLIITPETFGDDSTNRFASIFAKEWAQKSLIPFKMSSLSKSQCR